MNWVLGLQRGLDPTSALQALIALAEAGVETANCSAVSPELYHSLSSVGRGVQRREQLNQLIWHLAHSRFSVSSCLGDLTVLGSAVLGKASQLSKPPFLH